MQPYFFPYIGYFQLIKEVDIYVNLEHVNFMKRSYMVRNKLKNDVPINISVSNGSQNKTCVEVKSLSDELWFNNFEKTLYHLYKKEKNYNSILENIILPWKNYVLNHKSYPVSISEFNFNSISLICNYLNIKTKFHSSLDITVKKRNEGLQEITKHFNCDVYINAIGGQSLYTKEDFKNNGINLYFIKMNDLTIDNKYSSILDLLFRYSKNEIEENLKKYELI